MAIRDPSQPSMRDSSGGFAPGTEGRTSPLTGVHQQHGPVEGPLASEPLSGECRCRHLEMRLTENDPRKSDGVEIFTQMEDDAERQYRRASPYNP